MRWFVHRVVRWAGVGLVYGDSASRRAGCGTRTVVVASVGGLWCRGGCVVWARFVLRAALLLFTVFTQLDELSTTVSYCMNTMVCVYEPFFWKLNLLWKSTAKATQFW